MAGVDSIQEVIDRQEQQRIIAERADRLVRQQAIYAKGFEDGRQAAAEEEDDDPMGFYLGLVMFLILAFGIGLAVGLWLR